MIEIIRATEENAHLLSDLGKTTYIESHAHSAPLHDINSYIKQKYNTVVLAKELQDQRNIYHFILKNNRAAGFSKIILNEPHPDVAHPRVSKLQRLYLLSEFYGFNLGMELFNYNLHLSKISNAAGMWLFVWKENHRALAFYKKIGFKIIGSVDFRISETHSNPNHLMFLEY